ncbi:response regulator [Nocardioides yefusunii]|uniref:Response regulator n=1 Tax=Nocardioides yefusunii TaxID=2500546 RepID=A0ABW1QYF9_9ACTN|nr:response regulator [Nocardioides yefusunii]
MSGTTATSACAVVIDDDPSIRALYRPVLEQIGLEPVMTSNAADGIEAVREFTPVIVFLDVTMGGMDGFAALARIREFSDSPVVMISAHSDEIDVIQGLGTGADDYVFKPFRPRELRARVEALLRRAAGRSHPAAETAAPEDVVWRAPNPATNRPGPALLRRVETLAEPARSARPDVVADNLVAGANAVALVADTTALTVPVPAPFDPASATVPFRLTSPLTTPSANVPVPAPLADEASVHANSPASSPVASRVNTATALRHGELLLDLSTGRAVVGDQEVSLPGDEVNLLASLMETGTRVRSTANLVLALRGESYVTTYFVNDHDKRTVIDVMDTLRRRLGDTGPAPRWIEAVGTVGFRMTPA